MILRLEVIAIHVIFCRFLVSFSPIWLNLANLKKKKSLICPENLTMVTWPPIFWTVKLFIPAVDESLGITQKCEFCYDVCERECALDFTYMKWMNNVPYLCPPLELHSVIPEGRDPCLRNSFTNLCFSYSYSFIIVYSLGETIPHRHSDSANQSCVFLCDAVYAFSCFLFFPFCFLIFSMEPNRIGWA